MKEYAILVSPSANRVYADTSPRMLRGEIQVFDSTVLGGKIGEITEATIGGVPYLTFTAAELTERDVAFLSNLSSLYALFEVSGEFLRPIAVAPLDKFGSDLLTIQKYSGKTNEHFTRLLLNVTAMATDSPGDFLDRPLRVFDPMCGRGTTLNQAMMYGFDAFGVEIDARDFDGYTHFLKTWLRQKRLKHQAEVTPIRRHKERIGRRLDVGYGRTKEQYKDGDVRTVTVINADTLRSAELFRANSFDVLVVDTPYGVQHGSHHGGSGGPRQLTRKPMDLLAEAIPAWSGLVRPGGSIGLSWNAFVGDRTQLAGILADNGFDIMRGEAYLGFRHRVDQAIDRDLLVARRRG